MGRTWVASAHTALLFTVVLRPQPRHLSRISMLGGLAVYDVVKAYNVGGVGIKWPNDVQIKGRKVCGILPEALWEGDVLIGVALGIGVNIRVDFTDTPFQDSAINLENALGTPISRIDVLKRILERIDYWYEQLHEETFFAAWRDSLNMLGQFITVDGRQWVVDNVDASGGLLIRDSHGRIERVIAGDISLG